MRNLAQYPLTDIEIIRFCENQLEELSGINAPFGSMKPMIFQAIIERLKDHPREPEEILNQKAYIRRNIRPESEGGGETGSEG